MNALIYRTRKYIQDGARELRWAARLWWFTQEIEFLEWRWRLEGRLPETTSPATPSLTQQGGDHAMQPLSLLHG
jgi:hypothetical protein